MSKKRRRPQVGDYVLMSKWLKASPIYSPFLMGKVSAVTLSGNCEVYWSSDGLYRFSTWDTLKIVADKKVELLKRMKEISNCL